MTNNNKPYNLEERTFQFAKDVRLFVKTLKQTVGNVEDGKQVVRSSGSVGENYIEAIEKLGKKDFLMRAKISRKEAKESLYWIPTYKRDNDLKNDAVVQELINEANALRKILSKIISNTS